MTRAVQFAAFGAALLLASSANAAVFYTTPSPQQATDTSIAVTFASASATTASLSFLVDGYRSLDGQNYYQDDFRLTLNGTQIFAATFNLGGGSNTTQTVVFDNPYGATTSNPTGNGLGVGWNGGLEAIAFANVLPVEAGLNTLVFSYVSLTGPAHAGFQGLGDEGWGIEQVRVGGVPEPSTWAMMGLGFIGLAYAGVAHGRRNRLAPAIA